MKTTLIVIASSALTGFVAYQTGLWRQHSKDSKVFLKTMDAAIKVMKAETLQEAEDIAKLLEIELKEF